LLYVFLGAREPRIHDEARIALGLGEADDDLSLTRLDGAETSLVDMAQACGAIDMFGGRRKVLLTNAQALVASDKKVMPWLAEFAGAGSAAPCDLAALAYLDLGDRRSRSRVNAFSKLEDSGAQVRQVRPLDERRAAQFARRLAQRQGVRLDDAAAERLAGRLCALIRYEWPDRQDGEVLLSQVREHSLKLHDLVNTAYFDYNLEAAPVR